MSLQEFEGENEVWTSDENRKCGSPISRIARILSLDEIYKDGSNTHVRSFKKIWNSDGVIQVCQDISFQNKNSFRAIKGVESFENGDKIIYPSKSAFENGDKIIYPSKSALKNKDKVIYPSKSKFENGDKIIYPSKSALKNKDKVIYPSKSKFESGDNKTSKLCPSKTCHVVFALVAGLALIYINYSTLITVQSSNSWNLKIISDDLTANVFGQADSIAKINSVLNMCSESNDLYNVVFTGGVGVGKSYVSSIINQHFPWSSNKFIISTPKNKKLSDSLPNAFASRGCNLIRVDDLSINDVPNVINLISTVRLRMKGENVLLILIFNIGGSDEKQKMLSVLKRSHIHYYHIPFQNLTKEAVEKCFSAEIKKQRALVKPTDLKKLVEQQLQHDDIVQGPIGCKAVSDKIVQYKQKN